MSTTATPIAASTPTAAHHANLSAFITFMERLGIVALTLAPAIAAPFASPRTAAIIEAEAPVAGALSGLLAQALAGKQP